MGIDIDEILSDLKQEDREKELEKHIKLNAKPFCLGCKNVDVDGDGNVGCSEIFLERFTIENCPKYKVLHESLIEYIIKGW